MAAFLTIENKTVSEQDTFHFSRSEGALAGHATEMSSTRLFRLFLRVLTLLGVPKYARKASTNISLASSGVLPQLAIQGGQIIPTHH
jgi:hypothetical protein